MASARSSHRPSPFFAKSSCTTLPRRGAGAGPFAPPPPAPARDCIAIYCARALRRRPCPARTAHSVPSWLFACPAASRLHAVPSSGGSLLAAATRCAPRWRSLTSRAFPHRGYPRRSLAGCGRPRSRSARQAWRCSSSLPRPGPSATPSQAQSPLPRRTTPPRATRSRASSAGGRQHGQAVRCVATWRAAAPAPARQRRRSQRRWRRGAWWRPRRRARSSSSWSGASARSACAHRRSSARSWRCSLSRARPMSFGERSPPPCPPNTLTHAPPTRSPRPLPPHPPHPHNPDHSACTCKRPRSHRGGPTHVLRVL